MPTYMPPRSSYTASVAGCNRRGIRNSCNSIIKIGAATTKSSSRTLASSAPANAHVFPVRTPLQRVVNIPDAFRDAEFKERGRLPAFPVSRLQLILAMNAVRSRRPERCEKLFCGKGPFLKNGSKRDSTKYWGALGDAFQWAFETGASAAVPAAARHSTASDQDPAADIGDVGDVGAVCGLDAARPVTSVQDVLNWLARERPIDCRLLSPAESFPQFDTGMQYRLFPHSIARESELSKLFAAEGSFFAFHGTPTGHCLSVVRDGLRVASGADRVNGAKHGAGVYLSMQLHVASGYARLHNGSGLLAVCICQVAGRPEDYAVAEFPPNKPLDSGSDVCARCESVDLPPHKVLLVSDDRRMCARFLLMLNRAPLENMMQLANHNNSASVDPHTRCEASFYVAKSDVNAGALEVQSRCMQLLGLDGNGAESFFAV